MKSKKEIKLEKKILEKLSGKNKILAQLLFEDKEIKYLQDYANSVSIKRLKYNDHGPVHMRQVLLNAIRICEILKSKKIKMTLEQEENGNFEDSLNSVILASFLHDIGMTVTRDGHEVAGFILAHSIIDRILNEIYTDECYKRIVVRSTALEGIMGHMATTKIHSLEAGVILIADGCDMEKGRARIPMMIYTEATIGDIHKYSSAAVEKVRIQAGVDKPIKIIISMKSEVGLFQIEEVLLKKVNVSPLKSYIELYGEMLNDNSNSIQYL